MSCSPSHVPNKWKLNGYSGIHGRRLQVALHFSKEKNYIFSVLAFVLMMGQEKLCLRGKCTTTCAVVNQLFNKLFWKKTNLIKFFSSSQALTSWLTNAQAIVHLPQYKDFPAEAYMPSGNDRTKTYMYMNWPFEYVTIQNPIFKDSARYATACDSTRYNGLVTKSLVFKCFRY